MKLKVLHNEGEIFNPVKCGDAGFDIIAQDEPKVYGDVHHDYFYKNINRLEYNTKLNVQPELIGDSYSFYLLLFPRSSIVKMNLALANSVGVIDSGYSGDIKVCFRYISQPEDMKIISGQTFEGKPTSGILTSINPQKIYHKGDKIAQLVPIPHNALTIEKVDSLELTDRGSGGFGSTDKI